MAGLPTQSDVANACRVSRSTVAAVMQTRPSTSIVSDRTRQRVLAAAKQLNYRPHFAARSLRAGQTHHVGFAVPNPNAFIGTITSQILVGTMSSARDLGYALVACAFDEDNGRQDSFEDLVRSSRFDGFFYFGGNTAATDRRAQLCADWNKPYVVLQKATPGATSVYFDDDAGGRLAMRHLIEVGCRRVGIVSDHPGWFYSQRRDAALAEARTADVETIVLPLSMDFADAGHEAVDALIRRGDAFDGIYAGTDQTAMACIQQLARHGLSVPGDVAVVGHDDGPMAALATPALTSIHQDGVAMGRRAMQALAGLIRDDTEPGQAIMLTPKLVVRDSTRKVL